MQARARRTRQEILAAAAAEFSDKGLHGARVDAIARRAGANKERLYSYFGSKESLFREILKLSLGEVLTAERRLLEQLRRDPSRMTRVILEHYLEFHTRHPNFWRLLAWENLTGGKHAAVLRGIKAETYEELRGIYRRRQNGKGGVSFEAYLFTLSAISFFWFSNRLTMEETLALNLSSGKDRARLVNELVELLNHG